MKETERWQSKQKIKAVLEGVSLLWGKAYLGQPSACLFKRQAPGRVSLCDSGFRGGLAPLISWLCPHQVKATADFYSLNRRSDGYPSSQDSPLPDPSKVTNTLN